MRKITKRMCSGNVRVEDTDLLLSVANQIEGRTICAGEAASMANAKFYCKISRRIC